VSSGRMLLLVMLALGLLVAPLGAEAPLGKVYRIGYLATTHPPVHLWEALLDGLRERGYRDGQNLVFERRFSEGHAARFPAFAAELVQLRVDLILAVTTPAALAVTHASPTLPVVMTTAIDPVGAGVVASLARPGGSVTGNAILYPELSTKRLELLKEVVPRLAHVVVLWNAANPANASVRDATQAAARALGLRLHSQDVGGPQDLEGGWPSRPRRTRMRSSSWMMRSSGCTANTSRSSPPSSTCRACLPPGKRSWPAG
jgi:putative tryptophan/tyrosine transport system substrate-binding protein